MTSIPEPLVIGILIHIATLLIGSGFVRRLANESVAGYEAAGSPTTAQIVWSKWPPSDYLYFIMSRRFVDFLSGYSLRRDGEILFALYSAQGICIAWFVYSLVA